MSTLSLPEALARVQAIASDVAGPAAGTIDREGIWPEEALRCLQQAGLGGLVVPTSSGGLGHGMLALAQVSEVLGRACASTSLCFGMHSVGAAVLAAKATPDQRERFLAPIAAGDHLTTLALSEPGTGIHFYIPQTRLDRLSDDEYRMTGTKSFVTNGGQADSYVMNTAAADPQAPPGQFSCVVVEAATPGLQWQSPWQGWGMRGNSARSLVLQDVHVPQRNLLGDEGDEIWYVFNVVAPYFLIAMAGTYLGIASAALEEARRHLGSRTYAFRGTTLGQQTILQHRFGTLWATVERTRQLIYHAAALGDAGAADALPAICSAKAEVGDCVVTITNEVMTLLGGKAYGADGDIHRHLRDARAAHIMSPTTDMLRSWAGRALLGQPILAAD
jgi:alkylation response protein AidB-like acyl-CoA dehydrogenase